jgi:hypothetical protein
VVAGWWLSWAWTRELLLLGRGTDSGDEESRGEGEVDTGGGAFLDNDEEEEEEGLAPDFSHDEGLGLSLAKREDGVGEGDFLPRRLLPMLRIGLLGSFLRPAPLGGDPFFLLFCDGSGAGEAVCVANSASPGIIIREDWELLGSGMRKLVRIEFSLGMGEGVGRRRSILGETWPVLVAVLMSSSIMEAMSAVQLEEEKLPP